MTLEPEILPQAAVIPIRKDKAGNIQVLMVRREDKNKWGLPKGIIESDQAPEDTARAEAMEEAGISGKLSSKPVSRYTYRKKGRICHVSVFLMKVNNVHPYYDEQHIRERCWFSLPELATLPIRRRVRPVIDKLPQLITEYEF
ncbi:MAG: NUDIX hydrolase [Planctomycetota bacterium]|jgi:8-oxo-dGTP pyrophosphatase MutT (NUDIX family)